MPTPKGRTPAGDASLQQSGGHRGIKGEKQLPRKVEKETKKLKDWMETHRA